MLDLILRILFGDPRAIFFANVFGALGAICPCRAPEATPERIACEAQHQRAASVIAVVALDDGDPDEAAVLLLGLGAHETGFRTMVQVRGPAVSWWQLEVPRAQRAELLADPFAAARRALRAARGCRGSLRGYATGRCDGGGAEGERAAAELRHYVARARRYLAWYRPAPAP